MRVCAICVLAVPAMAQFYGLTTTDDGSQLYLSSTLQLAGSGDTLTSAKIFRYDGTKFTLFSELPRVVTNPAQPLATQYVVETNFYNLETPRVSGNGTTMGYVGYADCVGACFYNHVIAAQTTLQFANALLPLTLPGSCTISPNGRYALCTLSASNGNAVAQSLIDLWSMQQDHPSSACSSPPSNNGLTLEVFENGAVVLYSTGAGEKPLPFSDGSYNFGGCPFITPDGTKIVHSAGTDISIFDVATWTDKVAVSNTNGLSIWAISNDGRRILTLSYNAGSGLQAQVVDTADGTAIPIMLVGHSVSLAMSGDGNTVYGVTPDGQLLKVDAGTGAKQVLAAPPWIASIDGAPVPGSLNRITGTGFTGTQVTLNGVSLPALSSSLTEIDVQIPWETPLGKATLAVSSATPIPFQQLWPLDIQAVSARLAGGPFHQDFSALVSQGNPALPGETVQYYFTGLGPTVPGVADGEVAPASPLSLVSTPLTLVGTANQGPAVVSYAGLAPGLVGVYQVSITLPTRISPLVLPFPFPMPTILFPLKLDDVDVSVFAQISP